MNTKTPNPRQPSSRFTELYKCNSAKNANSQENRRKQFLENIRLKRSQLANHNRNVVTEDEALEEMDTSDSRNQKEGKGKGNYKNKVMHSEWFTEIPTDLEQNWVAKLCPVGSRRFIVAKYKSTLAFNRYGKIVDRFLSVLPGGSPNNYDGKMTLLDCIYNHQLKCYFVLDILFWGGNSLEDNNTECRFFFLKSKLEEHPEVGQCSEFNHRSFIETESFCPTPYAIQELMAHQHVINNQTVFIDGLLFYHKENPYIAGSNPLVGWLKPHMLPEMFNISVPDYYLDEKFCKALEANRKKGCFQNEELFNEMDTN